jgi:16S rRNA (guanine527-N7)-methyltransferase
MSNPTPPDVFGPEAFAETAKVSRETLALLQAYVDLLKDWNSRHNLVSKVSLEEVWHRHVLDSAQLSFLIPGTAKTLADLGSGAGFPGMVLAILRREHLKVSLFEATRKKAEFLRAVAEQLRIPVEVRNERIEMAPRQVFDVVTARALAPLCELLSYTQDFTSTQTICLFLKGQRLEDELTEAQRFWRMTIRKHPSLTHPLGMVLEIRDLLHGSSRN